MIDCKPFVTVAQGDSSVFAYDSEIIFVIIISHTKKQMSTLNNRKGVKNEIKRK